MLSNNQNDDILKHKPLKSVYCDVELRIKYRETKLQGAKFSNMVLIRCEPHKSFKLESANCIDLKMSKKQFVGAIPGSIRSRLKGSHALSLFLIVNQKLFNSFGLKIEDFWEQHKEEDGIVYVEYAGQKPF